MKLDSILTEKVVDISEDVDNVFRAYFKDFVEVLFNKENPTPTQIKKTIRSHITDSRELINRGILVSESAKKAHKANPIKIYINSGKYTNYYNTSGELSISLDPSILQLLVTSNFDINKIRDTVSKEWDQRKFAKIISPSNIKGSIRHELSHWIDDSLHNKHLKKRADSGKDTNYGYDDKYLSHPEIEAQIHEIQELKRQYPNIWDKLTFDKMLELSDDLHTRNLNINDKEYKEWRKKILKRMSREGLLGRNMRP